MAIAAPTRPSSTSWTLSSTASGSRPSENVRQDCASRSTSSTLRPCSASADPREATVVVLATPPFWFATAIVRVTPAIVPVLGGGGAPPPRSVLPCEHPPPPPPAPGRGRGPGAG